MTRNKNIKKSNPTKRPWAIAQNIVAGTVSVLYAVPVIAFKAFSLSGWPWPKSPEW